MSADQLVDVISRLGFPVAVTAWLLWRDYHVMKKLLGLMGSIERLLELQVREKAA